MYDPSRLSSLLAANGVDAMVACTRENVRYLGGFDPVVRTLNPYHGVCWVVVTRDAPGTIHVLHSRGESDQILDATAPVGETELYGTFYREYGGEIALEAEELRLLELMNGSEPGTRPAGAAIKLLTRLGLQSADVAIDEDGIPRSLEEEIRDALPDCRFRPGSELLRHVRRVKTAAEVDRLRDAAQSLESAIFASAAVTAIGSTEADVARSFERALVADGARPALTMLKVGRAAVGGQRRQLASIAAEAGDLLWYDCDAVKDGYWADIARVFAFGDDRRYRQRFEALHTGQREAMELIRPGMTGAEAFDLTMAIVHRSGFPEYRRHHVGHGIGLEPYERPILAPGNNDLIETGMVISVETPYYEFGLGALHIEDPILVGETENTRLTRTGGDLQIIAPGAA